MYEGRKQTSETQSNMINQSFDGRNGGERHINHNHF